MKKGSTSTSSTRLEDALGGIDKKFRDRIIKSYLDLRSAYATGEYDAAGLRAGVFSEAVARLLEQELTGTHTPFGTSLPNFADLCRGFERIDRSKGSESLRIIIPRALLYIYTLRNKRGIGHVGGDIEANEIDAASCLRSADWCVCELIRIYHKLPIEEAQEILNAIAVRQSPAIWQVGGKKRVLERGLGYADQILLLLHGSEDGAVLVEDVFEWIEHPRMSDFRKILATLHGNRLVEWDQSSETLQISPLGVKHVEETLLKGKSGP